MPDIRPATIEEQEQYHRLYAELQTKRAEMQAIEEAWRQFCFTHLEVVFNAKRPQGAINA